MEVYVPDILPPRALLEIAHTVPFQLKGASAFKLSLLILWLCWIEGELSHFLRMLQDHMGSQDSVLSQPMDLFLQPLTLPLLCPYLSVMLLSAVLPLLSVQWPDGLFPWEPLSWCSEAKGRLEAQQHLSLITRVHSSSGSLAVLVVRSPWLQPEQCLFLFEFQIFHLEICDYSLPASLTRLSTKTSMEIRCSRELSDLYSPFRSYSILGRQSIVEVVALCHSCEVLRVRVCEDSSYTPPPPKMEKNGHISAHKSLLSVRRQQAWR